MPAPRRCSWPTTSSSCVRHPRSFRDAARLALFALFGVVLNQILFVEGLARTTPAHSSIINSLIPVLTMAIALVAGQEGATPGRVTALGVSFASVLLLLGIENFRIENQLVAGDLLTLANGVSVSIFLVISHGYLKRSDPLAATSYLLLFGAIGILLRTPQLPKPLGSVRRQPCTADRATRLQRRPNGANTTL